jgi:hypothetical protein
LKGKIIMKNKLLLSTAIASVAFAGAAFSETKIGGNLEQTFVSSSENGQNSLRGFGAEHNISLSASKDLDNGMTASYGTILEDGNADTHYLTVGTDMVTFSVARDNGNNLSSSAIPYIGDAFTSINQLGAITSNTIADSDYHDNEHARIDINAAGGTITLGYAPSIGTDRPGDSAVVDSGNSASAIIYKGNLGVEGLSVLAGIEKGEGAAGKEDASNKQFGAAYTFGQFSVGVERQDTENAGLAAEQVEVESTTYAVSFAASDNLSVGFYMTDTEESIGGTKSATDEEIKMVQVGYNLAGLGLSLSYADVDNVSNVSGTDGEQFQIRTIQKF